MLRGKVINVQIQTEENKQTGNKAQEIQFE
jgi:hypothetical protein